MGLSRGIAYTCVVFGFVIILLACGCIAAGAFAMSKLSVVASTVGLWAIYVSPVIHHVL